MSEEEWKTRVDLAAAFRLVDLFGWSDLLATHLSARVPNTNGEFLINPFGLMFDEITASSLIKVDQEGKKLSDSNCKINPVGLSIHGAIHAKSSKIKCIIHTHTTAGLGIATQKMGLLPLNQQALSVIAHIGYHDYNGIAFNQSECKSLLRDLAKKNILILRNHGLLTVGESIAEAFMWMYRAERACRFQLAFQQSGAEPRIIDDEIQRITINRNIKANSPDGYRTIGVTEWPALKRKLDRQNPGYDT